MVWSLQGRVCRDLLIVFGRTRGSFCFISIMDSPKQQIPSRRRLWYYTASYAMLAVAFAMFICREGVIQGLFLRVVISVWAASAIVGIACVFIGSGGLSRRNVDTFGNIALALHICSLGFLMLLETLAASAP